jgi:nucleoside 2-deoxyribosyltransferase
MQYGEPFDTIYRDVVKPEGDRLHLQIVRVDELAGPGIIFEDIKRQISESKIVNAEITASNQNVFYELGYAHALNKPTILLAQRGKELPFDIRSYRVFYDDSIGGKSDVEQNLDKHLRAVLQEA